MRSCFYVRAHSTSPVAFDYDGFRVPSSVSTRFLLILFFLSHSIRYYAYPEGLHDLVLRTDEVFIKDIHIIRRRVGPRNILIHMSTNGMSGIGSYYLYRVFLPLGYATPRVDIWIVHRPLRSRANSLVVTCRLQGRRFST